MFNQGFCGDYQQDFCDNQYGNYGGSYGCGNVGAGLCGIRVGFPFPRCIIRRPVAQPICSSGCYGIPYMPRTIRSCFGVCGALTRFRLPGCQKQALCRQIGCYGNMSSGSGCGCAY